MATIQAFKIGQHGNEIVFSYLRNGEVLFIKYLKLERINGKKQMHVEPNCEPCLFGWNMLPDASRSVIICEGEIDAMTLYQYGLPALSVPLGAGGGKKH
jgi:twinkle protein